MAFVVPTVGAGAVGGFLQSSYLYNSCTAQLFVSNITPAVTHSLGNFTSAANVSAMPCSSIYTNAVTSAAGTATLPGAPFTLTQSMSTSQTIYGWYVFDTSSNLIFAERFATPAVLADSNDGVAISGHKILIHGA